MSVSAQGAASPKRIGDMLPNNNYQKVLDALVHQKSMAFLELTSLSNLEDDELTSIISWFETHGLVSVTDRNDVFQEVITLRDKGFALARELAKERELQLAASFA